MIDVLPAESIRQFRIPIFAILIALIVTGFVGCHRQSTAATLRLRRM